MSIKHNHDEHKAWLKTLKVGDKVAISVARGFSGHTYRFMTIERMTATQFVCKDEHNNDTRVKREYGNLIGHSFVKIEPITDAVHAKREANKLADWFKSISFHDSLKPTTDQLRAMHAAWKEHAPKLPGVPT